ncbi:hypothetical protein A2U01_0087630, partial [Trifolium medium]|nr:hypothetical protein [Trifolium medium]
MEKAAKSSKILAAWGARRAGMGRKAPVAAGFCCLLPAQRAGRAAHCA